MAITVTAANPVGPTGSGSATTQEASFTLKAKYVVALDRTLPVTMYLSAKTASSGTVKLDSSSFNEGLSPVRSPDMKALIKALINYAKRPENTRFMNANHTVNFAKLRDKAPMAEVRDDADIALKQFQTEAKYPNTQKGLQHYDTDRMSWNMKKTTDSANDGTRASEGGSGATNTQLGSDKGRQLKHDAGG